METTGPMDLAAQSRALADQPIGSALLEREAYPKLPAVVLPVVTRSVSLLTLLLQEGAVDLELASSVVRLDPGLTFGTLQLANRDRGEGTDLIWQLPLAVVAAGRQALEQLVQRAPRIESCNDAGNRTRLSKLASNAVARACVAYLLARELGSSNPRKSYPTGLLFELPAMVRLALPATSQAALLSTMCHSLPAAMVRAAMAPAADEDGPSDPIIASVLIADAVLRARAGTPLLAGWMEELAARPLWHCWKETNGRQRTALLAHCCEMAGWATANLHQMDPWEFMARLERRNCWE